MVYKICALRNFAKLQEDTCVRAFLDNAAGVSNCSVIETFVVMFPNCLKLCSFPDAQF